MDSALHQLQQLQQRLDAQNFEAGIIGGRLFVITPAENGGDGSRLVDVLAPTSHPDEYGRIWYRGEPRYTMIVSCKPRLDDSGKLWFFDDTEPIEQASHVIDAALYIGSRLMGAKAGR
jgi:hypothetical protein